MNVLELVGTILGLWAVWLTIRQNILCWPIGITMTALYVVVFWDARLYADAGLYVIYVVLQGYGWYLWLHGGDEKQQLPVTFAAPNLRNRLLAIGVLGSGVLGFALAHTPDAAPYLDAFITSFGLISQWMEGKKLLECWLGWVVVNVTAVGVYFYKGLYLTSVLYIVFLVLAVVGYREWKRGLRPDA